MLKINGDQSGKYLVSHLIDYAKQQGHITFVEDVSVDHIIQKDNKCHGIMGHIHKNEVADNFVFFNKYFHLFEEFTICLELLNGK